nr:MAG TPA: hypothetical protein [Caudoviricetes sp.]
MYKASISVYNSEIEYSPLLSVNHSSLTLIGLVDSKNEYSKSGVPEL